MVIRSQENLIGARVFLIGVVLAIVVGILSWFLSGTSVNSFNSTILSVMLILGLIVGYFVSEKDVSTFLIASVSVVIVSFAGVQGIVLNAAILGAGLNKIMTTILGALLYLFIPATIIVAVKTVYSISKS